MMKDEKEKTEGEVREEMERKIVTTGDGSHSLYVPALDEQYHSRHGALQESLHVFIGMGYRHWLQQGASAVRILEIGFGTGLNALLTVGEARQSAVPHMYIGVEAYPLSMEEAAQLNYAQHLATPEAEKDFERLHAAPWGETVAILDNFELHKLQVRIEDFARDAPVDIIYFDAFAPNKQPELWTQAIFKKMFQLLRPGGLLVTYCAKGDVRRAMLAAGFDVARIPGPPGKREMLRAVRRIP